MKIPPFPYPGVVLFQQLKCCQESFVITVLRTHCSERFNKAWRIGYGQSLNTEGMTQKTVHKYQLLFFYLWQEGLGRKWKRVLCYLLPPFWVWRGTSPDNGHILLYFSSVTCVSVWQSLASMPCALTSEKNPGNPGKKNPNAWQHCGCIWTLVDMWVNDVRKGHRWTNGWAWAVAGFCSAGCSQKRGKTSPPSLRES